MKEDSKRRCLLPPTVCWGQGSRSRGGPVGHLCPWTGTCHARPVSAPNAGPPLGRTRRCVCKHAHTCGHGVGTPADLSVCPASAETRGCPGPHLNTLPAPAPPHGNPRHGAGVWETWTGGGVPRGGERVKSIRAPGRGLPEDGEVLPSAQETPPRAGAGGGSRKMGKCSPLPRKRPPEHGVSGNLWVVVKDVKTLAVYDVE